MLLYVSMFIVPDIVLAKDPDCSTYTPKECYSHHLDTCILDQEPSGKHYLSYEKTWKPIKQYLCRNPRGVCEETWRQVLPKNNFDTYSETENELIARCERNSACKYKHSFCFCGFELDDVRRGLCECGGGPLHMCIPKEDDHESRKSN